MTTQKNVLYFPGFCDPINLAKYSIGPKIDNALGVESTYAFYPRVFSDVRSLAYFCMRRYMEPDKEYVLIGHSLGGLVADCIAKNSQNTTKVISVASPIDGLSHWSPVKKEKLPAPIPELYVGIKKDSLHYAIGASLDVLVGRQTYDVVIPRTTHISIMYSKGLFAEVLGALS